MNDVMSILVTVVFLTAAGVAFVRASVVVAGRLARGGEDRAQVRRDMVAVVKPAAVLGGVQLVALGLAVFGGGKLAGGVMSMAGLYLLFALAFPVMWAGGKVEAMGLGAPRWGELDRKLKLGMTAVVATAGLAFAAGLFMAVDVRPGATVSRISEMGHQDGLLLVLAFLLVFNAPWVEEIVFRHCLLVQGERWLAGRGRTGGLVGARMMAVLGTSVVFALVHWGNMEPAWAKFLQTFVWALGLAWVRLMLGTPWAMGLHLVWNVGGFGLAGLVEGA